MFPVFMLIGPLFWLALIVLGGYLGLRAVRALEQRGAGSSELAELRGRIQQVEEALEASRSDIERLREGQDFTAKLLAGRGER